MNGLLQFNPHKRLSVEECLKMEIFDDIRLDNLENETTDVFINLEIDKPGAYDWDTFTDKVCPHRRNYMKLILDEVKLIK